jgi:catechol-2,3-dioxygenase
MAFTGIDSLVYGVGDMAQARRFMSDAGLKKIKSTKGAAIFEVVNGGRIVLRPAHAGDLPPPVQNGPTVREIVWGVSAKSDLKRIGRELARDRAVIIDQDGTLHALDPAGIGIAFRQSRPRPVDQEVTEINEPARKGRIDQRATYYDRATPQRISHAVFTVPDYRVQEKFYTERLGFHVSDYYSGKGVFLRSAARANHHHLFFVNAGKVRINHVALAVRNIHELLGGGNYMMKKGWKTEAGPGRHLVSSAYFWYVRNPCGGALEYHWDEDYLTEKWKPGQWDDAPQYFAEWMLDDGIPPSRTLGQE